MNCPVTGCSTPIGSDIVMCRAHWYRVPKDLRTEVWTAFRRRLNATDDEEYEAAADRHEHAKAAAITAATFASTGAQ